MINYQIKKFICKCRWRSRNRNNSTSLQNLFDIDAVSVGNYTYGELTVLTFKKGPRLKVGNFCSIASGVVFVLSADHDISRISTFPFKTKCLKTEKYEAVSKGDIKVGDDVWIGQNAIILSGVNIGQGAVIAAGAVVTKDVPPYAIVAGVPAKIIRYRFETDIVDKMLHIDFSKLDKNMVLEHIQELYGEVTTIEQIEWMPTNDL